MVRSLTLSLTPGWVKSLTLSLTPGRVKSLTVRLTQHLILAGGGHGNMQGRGQVLSVKTRGQPGQRRECSTSTRQQHTSYIHTQIRRCRSTGGVKACRLDPVHEG